MKFNHVMIAVFVISLDVNAAEQNDVFATLETRESIVIRQNRIIATGQFEITEDMEPDNGIGLATDNWEETFIPNIIFKDIADRDRSDPIVILVENNLMPYSNWGISRGEATDLREVLQAERRSALMLEKDALDLAYEAQSLDLEDYEHRTVELEQALVATFDKERVRVGVDPNHSFSGSKDVSVFPNEEYLVFLTPSHIMQGTYSFGSYNEGLYRGEDKYPVLKILEDLYE